MRIKLIHARFDITVCLYTCIYKSFGSYLRASDEVGQFVELLACVRGSSFGTDATDVLCIVEDRETVAFERIHKLYKTHIEASVGLVGTVISHCVGKRHTGERLQLYVFYGFEKMYGKSFECFYNIFLFDERHFAVDLSKFGLAVCSEVFVAETFYYLEVTVEA